MGNNDEPFSPYSWESKPSTKSWIKQLSASDAKAQCVAWNLEPKSTLEGNRALLSEFVEADIPPLSSGTGTSLVASEPKLTPPSAEDLILQTAAAVGQQIAA